MTEIIDNILELKITCLIVVYLVFAISTIIKKTYNNNIRVIARITFTSVLATLFIMKMIIALICGRSIISNLIGAILWIICTAIECSKLKDSKRTIKYEWHIIQDFIDINEDIIYGELKEVTDENNN